MNKCKSCYQSISAGLQEINETRKKLKKLKRDYKNSLLKLSPNTNIKSTTKNFNFEILNDNSCKDLATGLTWTVQKDFKGNHYQTIDKFGDALPTKEEFEVAETHGIREVLPMKDKWFWSSSVYPNNSDYAFSFGGASGFIYIVGRSAYDGEAVCVSGR